MPNVPKLYVWQWNCRGYRRKQSTLSLYISQQTNAAAAIVLQELNMTPIKLRDYKTYQKDQYTAILVHQQYTAILQEPLDTDTSHCHVTILPIKRGAAGIHILNVYWDLGVTPQIWKKAEVRFIPKPNKELKLENLRPISPTSCLGKLFKRVINTRLTKFIERNSLLSNTQFGFWPHMSTQDILLWIYNDLLEEPTMAQTRYILALDLRGAFDNVLHRSILKGNPLSILLCRALSNAPLLYGQTSYLIPGEHPIEANNSRFQRYTSGSGTLAPPFQPGKERPPRRIGQHSRNQSRHLCR